MQLAQDRSLQIYETMAYPQAVARQQPDIASDSPRTLGPNQEKQRDEQAVFVACNHLENAKMF